MERKRALLEALKYLTAAEVLHLASVSRLWHSLSLSEELWVSLLGPEGLLFRREMNPLPTLQEAYRVYCSKECYALRGKVLYRYQLTVGEWTELPLAIDWYIPPSTVTLSLTHHQLFVHQVDGKTLIITLPSGSIELLPSLSRPRAYPGMCLYGGFVYAFGGNTSKKCDKLELSTRIWTELPDCHHSRQAFNPAIYQNLIYLPNGCQETIETFDPQTQLFCLLKYNTSLINSSANLIYEKKLIILGLPGYYIVDLDREIGEKRTYGVDLKTAWSVYTPILCGKEVVLVWTYNELWKLAFVNIHSYEARYIAIPNSTS